MGKLFFATFREFCKNNPHFSKHFLSLTQIVSKGIGNVHCKGMVSFDINKPEDKDYCQVCSLLAAFF